MIQRIQTVYLIFVALVTIFAAFSPLAVLVNDQSLYDFLALGVYPSVGGEMVSTTFALIALLVIVAILSVVEIFMFKKRILQMRIGSFSILLLIGFYALFGYFTWATTTQFSATLQPKFALGMPFIAIVLEYLAIRAIGKDEALIRSLNRIR